MVAQGPHPSRDSPEGSGGVGFEASARRSRVGEERVRAAGPRVGGLLRAGGGVLLWEAMEQLRETRAHLELLDRYLQARRYRARSKGGPVRKRQHGLNPIMTTLHSGLAEGPRVGLAWDHLTSVSTQRPAFWRRFLRQAPTIFAGVLPHKWSKANESADGAWPRGQSSPELKQFLKNGINSAISKSIGTKY